MDVDQRAALLGAKLRALVAGLAPESAPPTDVAGFPGGAGTMVGDRAFVLVAERPAHGLGRALAWADQRRADELTVLVDEPSAAEVLARQAAEFAAPPSVRLIDGRTAAPVAAAPPLPPPGPDPAALELVALLVEAGLDVVVEHGQVTGEVRGLEVARVVVDDQGSRVEVGVGRHDREAFAMVHGDLPTPEALAAVTAAVQAHRRPGARAHPLGQLAAERWLRAEVLRRPATVGAAELTAAEPALARGDLRLPSPAVAVGRAVDGAPLVVACSVGVDLDLVPAAADARALHQPDARLALVLPERDALAVTHRLASALVRPAEVVAVGADWRAGLDA